MLSFLRYLFKYRQKTVDQLMLYISLVAGLAVLFHIGYNTNEVAGHYFEQSVPWIFYGLFVLVFVRTALAILVKRRIAISHYGGLVLIAYFIFVAVGRSSDNELFHFLRQPQWLYLGIFAVFLTQLSKSSLFFDNFYFNPTILFVISFLFLILIGTLLLMLPKAGLEHPLPFIDALFMATSAVCITGLSTIDVATVFSPFGHAVLLILIQLGGLGIMTFTGFFGYFFSGGFSYKNQLMYSEFLGQNKVASVISTLLKIIFLTLFFEVIGAIFIFFNTEAADFRSTSDRVFFAVFHAVSAFCNAGFSTAIDDIYHTSIRYNYSVQLILAGLFIAGGFGFAIIFNVYTFVKRWAINFFHKLVTNKPYVYRAWVIHFNTRLVMSMTAILLVGSTLLTYLLEYGNTLQEHPTFWGKWVAAFFMGNSSRTAGFSIVDMDSLSAPTIVLSVLLMWIGAAPGSTGGGIKTTTFAIAILNIISLARGKDKLEIFGRDIAPESIHKAFAIIALSIFAVGITVFALSITDGHLGLVSITFESFSAYATCGLSLGITPLLSPAGKAIIIGCMFIGRVGLLTLLVALIKNVKSRSYEYPQEKVLF